MASTEPFDGSREGSSPSGPTIEIKMNTDRNIDRTHKAIAFVIAQDYVERHPSYHNSLFNLMINDMRGLMKEHITIDQVNKEKPHIKGLLNELAHLLSYEIIESRHAKTILTDAWNTDQYAWDIGWYLSDSKILDEENVDSFVKSVIEENEKAWQEFCNGKDKAIKHLIGQVMKKAKGKTSPSDAIKLFNKLREK